MCLTRVAVPALPLAGKVKNARHILIRICCTDFAQPGPAAWRERLEQELLLTLVRPENAAAVPRRLCQHQSSPPAALRLQQWQTLSQEAHAVTVVAAAEEESGRHYSQTILDVADSARRNPTLFFINFA
jgi:hypothetical protein